MRERKRVIRIDLDTLEEDFFDSVNEAARQTGVSKAKISLCCNRRVKQTGGAFWRFAKFDETEKTYEGEDGKICRACETYKHIEDFGKNSQGKNGRSSVCKKCTARKARDARRDKEGCLRRMCQDHIRAVHKKEGIRPYSAVTLQNDWLGSTNFQGVYSSWAGYNRFGIESTEYGVDRFPIELKPVVDIIDPEKGYSLDNIQVVAWKDHKSRNKSKRVRCSNEDESKVFNSVREAARFTGVIAPTISKCCNGILKSSKGYYFEFEDEI